MIHPRDFVANISELTYDDAQYVGTEAARLGQLASHNIPIKKGFVVTPNAFYLFLKANKLDQKMRHLLGTAHFEDPQSVYHIAQVIRKLIDTSPFPSDLQHDIHEAYKNMSTFLSHAIVGLTYSTDEKIQKFVSSAKSEHNLQHVSGDAHVLASIRHAWAILISPRIVFDMKDDLVSVVEKSCAILVQQAPEPQVSGKMYIKKNSILFKVLFGPFDASNPHFDEVQLNPKNFEVDSQTHRIQKIKLAHSFETKYTHVSTYLAKKPKLNLNDIHILASLAHSIQIHSLLPQEVDWIKVEGRFFITGIKDLKESPAKITQKIEETVLPRSHHTAHGEGMSKTIGIGPVKIIKHARDIHKISRGQVVIVPRNMLHHFDELKRAGGIIIEHQVNDPKIKHFIHLTQIPTVSNIPHVSKILRDGDVVTVHAKKGTVTKGSMMVHNIF